jgi:hypothetical protein
MAVWYGRRKVFLHHQLDLQLFKDRNVLQRQELRIARECLRRGVKAVQTEAHESRVVQKRSMDAVRISVNLRCLYSLSK